MKLYLACVALVAACGDSGGSISIDDLPDHVTEVECNIELECGYVTDTASCKAAVNLDSEQTKTIIADVKAGIIKYDGDKAAKCFDAADVNCLFQGVHSADDDPCNSYLTGTVAKGGACFFSQECAGGADCAQTDNNCDNTTTCCPGTCGDPASAKAAVGAACGDTVACDEHGYCKTSGSGSSGTCTAIVTTEGAACDDILACANNMICDSFSGTGKCYLPKPEGGACDPNFILADFACADERDYCDATSSKCVKRVDVGATCDDSILCKGTAGCFNSKCVANAAAGAACDDTNGPSCGFALSCDNGTCAAEPSGTSCR